MNEMINTNKLLEKAVQGTYKKLTNVQKQNPKNFPHVLWHIYIIGMIV